MTAVRKSRRSALCLLQPVVTALSDCYSQVTALCPVPSCRHHLPVSFPLSRPLSCYRTVLPTCLSFRKALCFRPPYFAAVFEILLSACGTAACFGFSGSAPAPAPWVLLLLLPGLRCFLNVLLINFWRRHAAVLLSWPRAWSFRVFACACS